MCFFNYNINIYVRKIIERSDVININVIIIWCCLLIEVFFLIIYVVILCFLFVKKYIEIVYLILCIYIYDVFDKIIYNRVDILW